MDPLPPRALLFDVFGTLVDWRTSIIAELAAFGRTRGIDADWTAFAEAWRAAYAPSMDRVRRGEQPWKNLDALHRASFDALVERFGIRGLTEPDRVHLANAWHRLRPWPDTVAGMKRLRRRFILASLSNGNVALQVDLRRYAGLPFDMLFSAETFHHYKPDPETYRGAVTLLGLQPHETMLVAAHNADLHAAAAQGLRTAFVARPGEYGPRQDKDLAADAGIDAAASDLIDLAGKLGA